jgi:hypothetical protein
MVVVGVGRRQAEEVVERGGPAGAEAAAGEGDHGAAHFEGFPGRAVAAEVEGVERDGCVPSGVGGGLRVWRREWEAWRRVWERDG